jgi:putative transposase
MSVIIHTGDFYRIQDLYKWRTGKHAVFELYAHLVFTPKYRKKVFNEAMLLRLEMIMKEQCLKIECSLIEFNGEKDHIHLLVSYPAKIAISSLIKTLKGVSSRLLRKEFHEELKEKLWGDHFWSPSYCAVSCGGAPLEAIKKYIQEQDRPMTENQKKMLGVVEARWHKR